MKNADPASQIFFGLAFLAAASTRSGAFLGALAAGSAMLALLLARTRFLAILRRSRWLLLTLFVLFAWLTPGTWIPGLPGVSREGLALAAENIARLTIAMASVAILLGRLPPAALVAGLRSLLGPLRLFGGVRDRLAVRLMLTLEAVETGPRGAALPPASGRLSLPAPAFGLPDLLLSAAAAAMLVLAVAT